MEAKNQIILESLGAAGTVTGSKHLLKTPQLTILVDCGLFQGVKSLRQKNWDPFPVDPGTIGVLLLTHAHLDHCGDIPLLVKKGFKGKIYCTAPTADLATMILKDSAKIQEEDADRANKNKYSKHEPALPLYNHDDVEAALSQFIVVDHSTDIKLSNDISFQFRKNGHILGSCCIVLNCYNKKIIFSGDIGRYNSKFLMPPEELEGSDFLIMESTYGDRLHPTDDPSDQISEIINQTLAKGGNILIPSFAVGRAQEIMHLLNELKLREKIPKDLHIFLDSPMAASATELLQKYMDWHRLSPEQCNRIFKDVTINRNAHGTKDIIATPGSKIIISASGMLTGGRVLEYLTHYVINPNNTVLLLGFQAEGTRGRALENHTHEVKIFGKFYPVRCMVADVAGLSGHGDQNELLKWVTNFGKKPQKIFLVHGEPAALDAFRIKIKEELKIEVQIQVEDVETVLFSI